MRAALVAAWIAALPAAALADVDTAVSDHILSNVAVFAGAPAALAATAATDGAEPALQDAYHSAFDAWLGISHLQFGPMEDLGLSLSFAFWPDPRSQTGRALGRLIAADDPVVLDAEAFVEVSVAAQGLMALERMLFEPPVEGEYACALTRAIAGALAGNAAALARGWDGYADTLRSGGTAGNTRYQSAAEAERALYAALSTGLEFLHDQRLGRPLGTFDQPRPTRA